MKSKALITACFAGVGIYLVVTGSLNATASLYVLSPAYQGLASKFEMVMQFFAICVPLISGLIFIGLAPWLASIVCHRSKLAEDEPAAWVSPVIALTFACVVSSLVLGLYQIPEFVRLLSMQFLAAASPMYAAEHRYEDYRVLMVRPGIYSAVAIIVLWKAKALAGWLVSRYDRP